MSDQKTIEYYQLLEKLNWALSSTGEFDRQAYIVILRRICELFHIAKGETEFYRSPNHEKNGEGECFCDFDNGHGDKILVRRRIVTKTNAVVIGTLYVREDEPPFSQEDIDRVDLMLRVIVSFVSRRRLQNVVEMLGYYDENGYPNLRSFKRFLDIKAEERGLYGYTAIHYNLRHFTLINREITREKGDVVIWNHFNRIKSIIGEEGIVCRLGGDSFLAAFLNEKTEAVLQMLGGVPIAYDDSGEKRVSVSACIGVFVMPEGYSPNSGGDIMDKVFPASQAAKYQEQGTVVYYSDEMLVQKDRLMCLQREFPRALENQEFYVYYQPKVNVDTGEIVGAEALCRWIRDERVIPPMEFIPTLERNTDICQLDFYMLDMVCRDIKRWLDQGRRVVRISVNLSRKHMVDPDLLEHILRIVEQNKVPHKYLEIELTETTTDVEFKDLKRVVGGLQKEGIYTSVDDFGMGYSSLNLIREIPWNVLKIDKSFLPVDGDNLDETTEVMFRHVVAMAKDLGLECITEGVETSKQVGLLRDSGCHIAQGYHFDKPLPVEEFEKRLDHPQYRI